MLQRVMLVGNVSLLGAGIEQLLQDVPDLIVEAVAPDSTDHWITQITTSHPNVIVLHQTMYRIDPARLLASLENHDRIRVVVIDPDDNQLHIYEKNQISVAHVEDLVAVIQGQ